MLVGLISSHVQHFPFINTKKLYALLALIQKNITNSIHITIFRSDVLE